MIKREMVDSSNDVAEYMAAKIFQVVAPGQGADLNLVRRDDKKLGGNNNPFLASKFFGDNYQDFYKEAGHKDRPRALESVQAGTGDSAQYMKQELNKKKYTGYEAAIVASILIGDYSMHSGNMGVVDDKQKTDKRKIVRIDFGAAFRAEEFQDQINPYKPIKEMLGTGPAKIENEKNYFLRDHPKEKVISQEFADELKRMASPEMTEKLQKAVNTAWKDIDREFTTTAKIDFGRRVGAQNIEDIPGELNKRLEKRQQGLKNMATEIELKLLDKDIKKGRITGEKAKEKLADIVKENPEHVATLLKDGKDGSEMKLKYSKKFQKNLEGAWFDHQIAQVEAKAEEKSKDKEQGWKKTVPTDVSQDKQQDKGAGSVGNVAKADDSLVPPPPLVKEDTSVQGKKNLEKNQQAISSEEARKTIPKPIAKTVMQESKPKKLSSDVTIGDRPKNENNPDKSKGQDGSIVKPATKDNKPESRDNPQGTKNVEGGMAAESVKPKQANVEKIVEKAKYAKQVVTETGVSGVQKKVVKEVKNIITKDLMKEAQAIGGKIRDKVEYGAQKSFASARDAIKGRGPKGRG